MLFPRTNLANHPRPPRRLIRTSQLASAKIEVSEQNQSKILSMHKNTEQGSLETLFIYIFHRLAQAENKCKQMDFEPRSLLRFLAAKTQLYKS